MSERKSEKFRGVNIPAFRFPCASTCVSWKIYAYSIYNNFLFKNERKKGALNIYLAYMKFVMIPWKGKEKAIHLYILKHHRLAQGLASVLPLEFAECTHLQKWIVSLSLFFFMKFSLHYNWRQRERIKILYQKVLVAISIRGHGETCPEYKMLRRLGFQQYWLKDGSMSIKYVIINYKKLPQQF